MSARVAGSPVTRTLPARKPDGFPLQHGRYFWYVLFAATGLVLTVASIELMCAIGALASGFTAWQGLLGVLRSPLVLLFNVAVLVGVLYFALRFLWVGVKIPSVQLGPIPAPPPPVILVAHFAGLLVVSLAVIVVLSGVVR